MEDTDLLQLADREQQRLTDENDHGAAIIMRALSARLRRVLADRRESDRPEG